MKLIIAGATSLLGAEIVRQSLQIPEITQVVALAHETVHLDESMDSSKVRSVVINDHGEYPDDVKAEFAGADACIWTVALTPLQPGFDFAKARRVCQDYTKLGFEAICEAGPARPFRFIYLSEEGTPRDPKKDPVILPDFFLIRRKTELMVQKFPKGKEGVEVCIARPGVIANSTTWSRALVANLFRIINRFGRTLPSIQRSELAAAVLNQARDGIEKRTLLNADLVRLGRRELKFRSAPRLS
ncbi:NAD(P)-binding domain [Penicillium camemberti]|uniref:NAD(P)-binding domain n=1 Tax=Penicillium camemberti (strain FM 013) TaxID=1429867 RepID=A0A0G4P350_PENC3|nr:NAD(P)-binding domain [Penicillium camemberti]